LSLTLSIEKATKHNALVYIGFLLWPFMALVYALFNYRAAYTRNIIWLFCAFFGYTFVITPGEDMDAARYKNRLEHLHRDRHQPYIDLLIDPYVGKGIYGGTDIYGQFVTLTVSRFTDDFRILFGLVGFVFGYFYASNICYILPWLKERKLNSLGILMLVVLVLVIPYWNINGYRFYTATHIFIFALLRVLVEGKRRYNLLILITPLVHGSFVLAATCAFVYQLFGNRYHIYFALLLLFSLSFGIDPSFIYKNSDLAPEFAQNKVAGYTRASYIKLTQGLAVGQNWYVEGHNFALKLVTYIFVGFIWLKRKTLLQDRISLHLYSCSLLMLSVAAFISTIPSGTRFFFVSLQLFAVLLLYVAQQNLAQNWVRWLTIGLCGPVFMYALVEIRIGFDVTGLNTIFLNPMLAPFFPDSAPLITLFK
jgi:hypothetical protein